MKSNQSNNSVLKVGIIGTVVAALCCFTPLLVGLLGAVGLGALIGYLDFVLLPAMVIFLVIAIYGFAKKKKSSHECCTPTAKKEER